MKLMRELDKKNAPETLALRDLLQQTLKQALLLVRPRNLVCRGLRAAFLLG